MFKNKLCSIENKEKTCYDMESLLIIGTALNKLGYTINLENKSNLYNSIKSILKKTSSCKNELCWLTWNGLVDNLTKQNINKLKSKSFRFCK